MCVEVLEASSHFIRPQFTDQSVTVFRYNSNPGSPRLLLRLWTGEFSGCSLHAGLASRSRSHESMEGAFRVQSESECVSCI